MKTPEELWQFPDTAFVPDGYDMKSIPDATKENMEYLVNEYNNLVEVVNLLCEKLNIKLEKTND